MAAGRPTVSNRTGDLVDLFEQHQIGFLASDDPEDITRKVLQLISDEELMAKLKGNEAYRWLQKHSMDTRKSMRQVAEAVLLSEEISRV